MGRTVQTMAPVLVPLALLAACSSSSNDPSSTPPLSQVSLQFQFPAPDAFLTAGTTLVVRGSTSGAGALRGVQVSAGGNVASATSSDAFRSWEAVVAIPPGLTEISAQAINTIGRGGTPVSLPVQSGVLLQQTKVMTGGRNGRALLVDVQGQVVEVDLTSGSQQLRSGAGLGSGPSFGSPIGLVEDAAGESAFVATGTAVYQIDLTTGDRLLLADARSLSRGTWVGSAIGYHNARDEILVAGTEVIGAARSPRLMGLSRKSGAVRLVSQGGRGTGQLYQSILGIAEDGDDDILVVGEVLDVSPTADVARINLDTGDRESLVRIGATATRAFAYEPDRQQAMVLSGRSLLTQIDLATGTTVSIPLGQTNLEGLATDLAQNGVWTALGNLIYSVDLDLQRLQLLTPPAQAGSGVLFGNVQRIAFDPIGDQLVLLEPSSAPYDNVLTLGRATNERQVVRGSGQGLGNQFRAGSEALFIEGSREVWTFGPEGIFRVDLDLGAVAFVTSLPTTASDVIAADWSTDPEELYVADGTRRELLVVNRSTYVANPLAPINSSVTGIATDQNRFRVLLADDMAGGLTAIDLASRGLQTVSDATTGVGFGPAFGPGPARDLLFDAADDRVFVLQDSGIVAVALQNGDRTALSRWGDAQGEPNRGQGPAPIAPQAVAMDLARGQLLVLAESGTTIYAVDLQTGDRTMLAR